MYGRNPYCCAIFVEGTKESVPLKEINVSIGVRGYLVNIESSLSYENKGISQLEAVFSFPVDENGAVYKFEMEIDGKTVIAECQEKQEAEKSYKEAVDQGYSASYMGEIDSTSDIFTCKLGNLMPGKSALVKFAYVSELLILDDGSLDFVLPTLLNPRYNPAPEKGGSKETAKALNGYNQPYKFEIHANIEGLGKISDITSVKDKLDVAYENEKSMATVKLSEEFVADHDFRFQIKIEDSHKPKVLIEKGKTAGDGLLKKDVVMLNFFPSLNSSSLGHKHEFIFVIDRSGSMRGTGIKGARDSLLLFLKSLPTGCYFNIVGFGSHFEALFKEGSVPYSEENLQKALNYQEKLCANMGGTEIFDPLQHIYKQDMMPTHSRQVLLITDGGVYNTSAVIRLVNENSHSTRVFTLGIGEGASTSLVKGVARAGRGKAEFVNFGDKMQPAVMRLLKYAMQAAVTNVSVEWNLGESVELTQIPKQPPPIFDKDRLIIFAVINAPSVLDGKVVLKGKYGEESVEYPIQVSDSKDILTSADEDSMVVHRMAAKVQIKQLQDLDDAEKKANKAAIVALSLASNVISSYTAMVAIDKSNKREADVSTISRFLPNVVDPTCGGGMPMRKMQKATTKGMTMRGLGAMPCDKSKKGSAAGSIFSRVLSKVLSPRSGYQCKQIPRMSTSYNCYGLNLKPHATYAADDKSEYFNSPLEAFPSIEDCSECIFSSSHSILYEKDSSNVFLDIISLVEFSGHWKLDDKLLHLLSLDKSAVKESSLIKDLDVWITAVVLSFFRHKFTDQKEEWEMIEMKATQWMSKQNLEGHSISQLLEHAKKILA